MSKRVAKIQYNGFERTTALKGMIPETQSTVRGVIYEVATPNPKKRNPLNQIWILDTKKKVKDVLKEFFGNEKFTIVEMKRFKVGEGV